MRFRPLCFAAVLAAALSPAVPAAQQPSAFEREILDQTNRARTDPAGFARDLEAMLPHFDGTVLRRPGQRVGLQTNEGPAAVREAIRFLRAQAPIAPLTWEDGLWRAAGDHVRDQGPRGSTGHSGNDGSSMGQRISRYGQWQSTAAENIDYGSANALDVLISLIVDDGVPSRGHRTNIFNARLRVMGAACGPHARYRVMCVMNYAGGYVAAGARPAAGTPSTQGTAAGAAGPANTRFPRKWRRLPDLRGARPLADSSAGAARRPPLTDGWESPR
ncbi:MAG TPA: CAP domain-containing protein [Gemmatimonadaceae bacterium]|nr:CAP domain-containing protein [Gemmatimonadaceae bacterium]